MAGRQTDPKKTLAELATGAPVAAPSRSELAIFSTEDGRVRIEARIEEGSVWLTQKLMAQLYGVSVPNIGIHLKNIFEDGELVPESVIKENLITATDGKNYKTKFYNLDAILHVGYRVRSPAGAMFRAWATERLKEYMVKGFTLDDERLKNPGADDSHYEELLARIRDIRTSEKRFYQKVRDLIAKTSEDYSFRKNEEGIRTFFASIQNKMLYATTGQTAAELIMARARADKVNMGLTSYKGDRVRIGDITISKNYLDADELARLNELVQMFILFAEDRANRHIPTHLDDWKIETDRFLAFYQRDILEGAGTRSVKQMEEFVRKQYAIYCDRIKQQEFEQSEIEYETDLRNSLIKIKDYSIK